MQKRIAKDLSITLLTIRCADPGCRRWSEY